MVTQNYESALSCFELALKMPNKGTYEDVYHANRATALFNMGEESTVPHRAVVNFFFDTTAPYRGELAFRSMHGFSLFGGNSGLQSWQGNGGHGYSGREADGEIARLIPNNVVSRL